mmetsp:Transcript_3351/g.11001  ORF Transcript_3351/g.11001 Transcript_3351/m.11001 type:complete len:239 (+) Transcript_3351:146-862(+)
MATRPSRAPATMNESPPGPPRVTHRPSSSNASSESQTGTRSSVPSSRHCQRRTLQSHETVAADRTARDVASPAMASSCADSMASTTRPKSIEYTNRPLDQDDASSVFSRTSATPDRAMSLSDTARRCATDPPSSDTRNTLSMPSSPTVAMSLPPRSSAKVPSPNEHRSRIAPRWALRVSTVAGVATFASWSHHTSSGPWVGFASPDPSAAPLAPAAPDSRPGCGSKKSCAGVWPNSRI